MQYNVLLKLHKRQLLISQLTQNPLLPILQQTTQQIINQLITLMDRKMYHSKNKSTSYPLLL